MLTFLDMATDPFEEAMADGTIFTVIGVILAVIIAAVVITVIVRSNRKKKAAAPGTDAGVTQTGKEDAK